jgi:hypothetical protein
MKWIILFMLIVLVSCLSSRNYELIHEPCKCECPDYYFEEDVE